MRTKLLKKVVIPFYFLKLMKTHTQYVPFANELTSVDYMKPFSKKNFPKQDARLLDKN